MLPPLTLTTASPLHPPAAAGHLAVCHAIVEPLKQRVALSAAAAAAGGSKRSAAAAKWRRLLATVLNQRSHKSLTPLMLACEHGHAAVAAYLLREGADPLAADFVHSRTCLHYAAVGGHADCLLLLCSDGAMVATQDGARPLRDVIVSDMQVGWRVCVCVCGGAAVWWGLARGHQHRHRQPAVASPVARQSAVPAGPAQQPAEVAFAAVPLRLCFPRPGSATPPPPRPCNLPLLCCCRRRRSRPAALSTSARLAG